MPTTISDEQMSRVAELVSAYVSQNAVPATELPALINSILGVLEKLAAGF
jgi:predicted transcriptional regulator